jgi:replicative DNA helicase
MREIANKVNKPLALTSTSPVNYEAEQALLGALLHNNEALEKVQEFLRPEHFANNVNGKIYSAICTLCDRGQVADPITLHDYFSTDEDLSQAGGTEYLVNLADSVVSIINTEHYGRIVEDLFTRRQLINIGEELVVDAKKIDISSNAIHQIEQAEQKLFNLAVSGNSKNQFQSLQNAIKTSIDMAETAYKRDSHVVGITSGFRDLDRWLGGLHSSDLLILAARPSMGKTALATNIAFNAAKAALKENEGGGHVAFFSLEMSADQLATRILSQECGVPSDKIRRGELSQKNFETLTKVSREINNLPLFIDDTPALTISSLRTRARRLKRQQGLNLIVVDYLQLLQGTNSSDNRVNEISEISRGLKAIAKELEVPVVALSQLSRAVEQRDDKRPMLADLRESGSIEQDADVVMFIFREEYYLSRQEPTETGTEKYLSWQEKMERVQNKADVIIAKQRHGPIGTIKLFFEGRYTKFGNLDTHHTTE